MSLLLLIVIQQEMTRYVLPISLGFGNIGNFILIGYFSQKHNRTNPCSLYLLAAAVFSIVGSNWGVIPTVYAISYSDPLSKSIVLCRIRLYIIYISAMSYRTMIVLATIDRYALTNARLIYRAFSSITVAKRAIIIMFLFWCMAGFHLLIWPTIEYNRCLVYGLYGFVYSIIQLITLGVLPSALMILFGVLLTKNLRLSRIRFEIATRQAINTNSRALRRRDKNLIVLVFTEILLTFICTFPYALHAIYTALTNNIPNKSVERQQIESFLYFFFVQYLLYLGYSTTFYGYMATSKSFRREVQILLLKLIGKTPTAIEQEPIEINVPRIITR